MPLQELWRDNGFVTTSRGRFLGESDIVILLRRGPVQFVKVEVGIVPEWIALDKSLKYWKTEVRPHLARSGRAVLNDFPDGYFYFASEWDGGDAEGALVALEKHH